MKRSIDGGFRPLRVVAGIGVLSAGPDLHSRLGAVGVIPLLSGIAGRCPISFPSGHSVCDLMN